MLSDENKSGGSGGKDWASLNDGDNIVRFLPGKEEPLDFFVEGTLHKYKDSEGHWRSYKCRKPHGEDCPMCNLYFDLWDRHKALNLGKDAQGKQKHSKFGSLATLIKAKPRYYAKIVVRDLQNSDEESPVKFLAMSQRLFNIVMGAVLDPDYQDEDDPDNTTVLSLDKGNDFNIRITKQGEFNSFDESKAKPKKSRAGSPKEVQEWMESELDLKSLVEIDSYEKGREVVQMLEASLSSDGTPSKPKAPESNVDDDGEEEFNKELKV